MFEKAFAFGLVAAAGATASAQFAGVSVRAEPALSELATSDLLRPATVVRLYANFNTQSQVMVASQLTGGEGFGLASSYLDEGGRFFQASGGGATAPNSGFFGVAPDLAYDTFVTINRTDALLGDSTTPDPDFAFVDRNVDGFHDFIAGGWFANPGNNQVMSLFNPSTNFHEILLAQITILDLEFGFGYATTPSSTVLSAFEGELTIFNVLSPGVVQPNTVQFEAGPIPSAGAPLVALGAGAMTLRRRR